jgi:transcriptional regulator GlxA family with amidase domain
MGRKDRAVVFAVFENVRILDLAGPLEAFTAANWIATPDEKVGYRCVIVSPEGGAVTTSSGAVLQSESLASIDISTADTLLVLGRPDIDVAPRQAALLTWIAEQAACARRVCSVCTGAFLLAEAGLLAGRRAVTHWDYCALLQQRYPEVRVEADPIFIRDDPIWTSAGSTAGIDLALALIEDDFGHRIAMRVARQLVMFLKRPGGQSQFSVPLSTQVAEDTEFGALHAWMRENLCDDLRVRQLAKKAGMSPRTFERVYTARVGRTPAKTVEAMRMEATRLALEDTKLPLKRIARDYGFGDEQRLRRAFLRQLGVTPLDYRSRFSGAAIPRAAPEARTVTIASYQI